MRDLSDLHIYKSDEMIDRAWNAALPNLAPLDTGDAELDEALRSMQQHIFRAGWLACMTAIIDTENRKDGIG